MYYEAWDGVRHEMGNQLWQALWALQLSSLLSPAPAPQAASDGALKCVYLGTLVTRYLTTGVHLVLLQAGYCPLVRTQWTEVGGRVLSGHSGRTDSDSESLVLPPKGFK